MKLLLDLDEPTVRRIEAAIRLASEPTSVQVHSCDLPPVLLGTGILVGIEYQDWIDASARWRGRSGR